MNEDKYWKWATYDCPFCGGVAYNGLPEHYVPDGPYWFKGSAQCKDCNESFSAMRMEPTGHLLIEKEKWAKNIQKEERMSEGFSKFLEDRDPEMHSEFYGEGKKPSAGLSKKKKSEVAKKASKGKDIGKKGKNFDKVAAKAKESGAKDPEAVAAAAMWKNIKRKG